MRTVEYDLLKSDYKYCIGKFQFYFSSIFNLRRFKRDYKSYVELETSKLIAKYHVNIDLTDYLIVAFYKKIEKRGFRILTYNENNDIIDLSKDYIFML